MNDVLTTTECSLFLRVTPGTVRSWCDRGLLPHVREGNKRVIVLKDLYAFMEDQGLELVWSDDLCALVRDRDLDYPGKRVG